MENPDEKFPQYRMDEDLAYGQWKQKQIDEDVYRIRQRGQQPTPTIIGGALPISEKTAKFARTDPNPNVPFVTPASPPFPWKELLISGVVTVVCLLLAWGLMEVAR